MIFIMVVMIFIMVVMIFIMVVMMIIVVIVNVNLAVEVFSFSPNQSGSNGSFDRERAAIAKTPLKNAT